jgi:hypothetical protein
MHIIISYCEADDANIMFNEDGEVLTFETAAEAQAYAKENCAWYFRVVDLGADQNEMFRAKFNNSSAAGEFWIKKDPYGASLFVKGANLDENGVEQSVLGIDLYYGNPTNDCLHNPRPIAQIVLDSSSNDPIGYIRLFPRAVGLVLSDELEDTTDWKNGYPEKIAGNPNDIMEINRMIKEEEK